MGQAKKDWMRQEEQGYSDLDGMVCSRCIEDAVLKKLHRNQSFRGECDFCGGKRAKVAPANEIQTRIMECLLLDYQDIQHADAPYDSQEGGYQVPYESAGDIVRDNLYQDVSEEFAEALSDALEMRDWCSRNWAILSEPQRLYYGWSQFCLTVKHRLRFSFAWDRGDEEPGHPDHVNPTLVLEQLGEFVDSLKLVKTLPIGTTIYRIRTDSKKTFDRFDDLAAPPYQFARSNRMSPAGIPMFYGSDYIDTAVAETWDQKKSEMASIGVFKTRRKVRVIDFDRLPEVPSYWEPEKRSERHQIGFLYEFAKDLSSPIQRGSLVDLHYTPTQIVSEFLIKGRFAQPAWDDKNGDEFPVHGIAFKSSRASGRNYALNFVNDCDDNLGFTQSHYLKLVDVTHRQLKLSRRKTRSKMD